LGEEELTEQATATRFRSAGVSAVDERGNTWSRKFQRRGERSCSRENDALTVDQKSNV
jgi:hypothetical protein